MTIPENRGAPHESGLLSAARQVPLTDGRRDVRAIADALAVAHPLAVSLAQTLSAEDRQTPTAPTSAAEREAPTEGRGRLDWKPSAKVLRRMLGWSALGGALIGLIGFAASFASVSHAAYPYLGRGAFTLPLLIDLGIFTFSAVSLVLELHEISSRLIRLIPLGLAAYTIYLNTATQPTWFGKAVHAAGPVLWVIAVEIATFTVRRMVALSSENAMGKVRAARWVLAPLSTFRLWRAMRLWEITDYRTALTREHERQAARALLREWHGRTWRFAAPSAQRLAVALHGHSAQPVAEVLARTAAGITAAEHAARKPEPATAVRAGAQPLTALPASVDKAADMFARPQITAGVDPFVDTALDAAAAAALASSAPFAHQARPTPGTAAQRIRKGWENGWNVTDTARYAGRDKAQVSRKFAEFDKAAGVPASVNGSH